MAEKKYLDREAVLATAFETLPLVGTSPAEAMGISRMSAAFYRAVRNIPAADVVPVVRCKDCKHYQHDAFLDHDWCDGRCVTPDYFCADGERRSMDGGEDDA